MQRNPNKSIASTHQVCTCGRCRCMWRQAESFFENEPGDIQLNTLDNWYANSISQNAFVGLDPHTREQIFLLYKDLHQLIYDMWMTYTLMDKLELRMPADSEGK